MLPKGHRLLTNYEFNKTRRLGVRKSCSFFDIYYLALKDTSEETRVGFVVSNKFSKIAPLRNRVKRLFREVVRKNFDRIMSGYWIVIYPKRESTQARYEEINAEFIKILQELPFSR